MTWRPGLAALVVGGSLAGVLWTVLAVVAALLGGFGVAVSFLGMGYVSLLLAAVCRIASLPGERDDR